MTEGQPAPGLPSLAWQVGHPKDREATSPPLPLVRSNQLAARQHMLVDGPKKLFFRQAGLQV